MGKLLVLSSIPQVIRQPDHAPDLPKTGWTAAFTAKAGRFTAGTSLTRWAWNILGPFPCPQDGGFDDVNEPEESVDLDKTYEVADDKQAQWKQVSSASHSMVDFASLFDPNENVCAYAVTYVKSPVAQKSLISAGSDDGIKIWVNKKEVLANNAWRGASPDQ